MFHSLSSTCFDIKYFLTVIFQHFRSYEKRLRHIWSLRKKSIWWEAICENRFNMCIMSKLRMHLEIIRMSLTTFGVPYNSFSFRFIFACLIYGALLIVAVVVVN
jgi:hypothetical protein